MPAQAYELLALGARYWFAFLGVVIVWRSFIWLNKDAKQRRKRLRQLPDAGLVGELVVLAGSEVLPPGTVIPLPREGTLGSLRSCDVSLPCPGVAARHGDFRFVSGVGLILTPAARQSFTVDGQEPAPVQKEWVMHHGSRLAIGDALLRMRLFMGLETARSSAFQQDIYEDAPMPEPALMAQEEWEQEASPVSYELPAAMNTYEPDWKAQTRPYRQQIRAWQDTARYDWAQSGPGAYTPDDLDESIPEWEFTGENEPTFDEEWPPAPLSAPPPKRTLFHRRDNRR